MSANVQLLVLGPPLIVRGGEPRAPGTQKALALAGYLGTREDPVAREQLATLLWSDSGPDQARRSLRGEVARLRKSLGDDTFQASRLTMWLEPAAVDVDVRRFRALLERGHDEQAVELYRGPLLEGIDLRNAEPFEVWLQGERHLLEVAYLDALRRLIRSGRNHDDQSKVLRWAWQAVRRQPLAEDLYVLAMEAAEKIADRTAVLTLYGQLRAVLRDEFGIEPGVEARALAERASGATTRSPVRTPRRLPRGHVGHERERATLEECTRRAANGDGGTLVFVRGPAGSGKTCLLQVAFGGRRAVWCPAQRTATTVAYYPIATGLRQYLAHWGVPPVDDLWRREAAKVCPELSRATPNPTLGAPEDKVRLLEGLSATLIGAAGQGGVLVFDDVQWADPDTVAVLDNLVRRLPRSGMVIVVAARDDQDLARNGVAEILASTARAGVLTDLSVQDLSKSEIVELLRGSCDVAGRVSRAWLDEFAAMVHQVLGGNPFYALECARLALDNSTEPPREPVTAVKFGLRDVLRTRLAALPPHLRRSAEAAAVIGGCRFAEIVTQMLEVDPWELADQLDELVVRGVLTDGADGLGFVHDLVEEVIYESLPIARRQLLHERAADALARTNSTDLDKVSGQIAAHLEAAGQPQAAIPYHERAAAAAGRSHAHQLAIHHCQRLRALVAPDRQANVLLQLGGLLSYDAPAEAEPLYQEALRLAAAHGDGPTEARCYFAIGVLSRRSAPQDSQQTLTQALRLFQVYANTDGVEQTLEALTYAYIQQGKLAAAAASASQAAEVARNTGRLPNLGRATLSRGIAHLYGGEYERARRCFETAREIANDTTDNLSEAEALRYLSGVYGIDGQLGTPEQAWSAAAKATEICLRLGHRMGLARAADGAGGSYLAQGDWQRALDCYVTAVHLTADVGYEWGFDAMVYRVGYTLLYAGELACARRALAHAETLSRTQGATYWLCRTLLAEAELATRQPDPERQHHCAESALELAQLLQHRHFIAEATTALGRPTAEPLPSPRQKIRAPASTLPDVPQVLHAPVHGINATMTWLDNVVAAHRHT